MKPVGISSFVVVCLCVGALLSLTSGVSALRCYQCSSGDSWSHCAANSKTVECSSTSQVSVMGRNIFLPAEPRQIELACLSVYAKGTYGGATGYAYVRDCFFNEKALCSLVQDSLPPGINIVDCDLCTTDLCNGAGSIGVTFSSVVLLAVAVLLWK